MTESIARLLAANLLFLACGVGVIASLRVATSWAALAQRIGLAYLAGLAAVGVASATLAVVGVPFGWLELGLLTALTLSFGVVVFRRAPHSTPTPPAPPLDAYVTAAGAAAIGAFLVYAVRAFAVTPLAHWDAWAMWGMKGRALATLNGADPAVFANPALHTLHLQYPLLLPSLEAIDFRSMGGFDGRVIHIQFLLLAVALVAALASLLFDRVPALVLWPMLGAIVTAPAFLGQLLTAYADVPLAVFVAAGVVAGARWIATDERWSLDLATLFFAAALLTKAEGTVFVIAAYLALAASVVGRRGPLSLLAQAAAIDLAAIAPWWAYLRVHDIHEDTFDRSALAPGALGATTHRGWGAAHGLVHHMLATSEWSLVLPLFAAGAVAAGIVRRRRLATYSVAFFVLALIGLTATIVVSRASLSGALALSGHERYVASIVLSSAALTPLLAAETLAAIRADRETDELPGLDSNQQPSG